MLISANPGLRSPMSPTLPPGALGGYLLSTPRRWGGLGQSSGSPTPPNVTVKSLLAQLGLTSAASFTCDCTGSKYCAPSTPAGCPSNQYQVCAYFAQSVANRSLCWPPPSAWISGATESAGDLAGSSLATAAGSVGPVASLVGISSIAGPVGALVGTIAGVITSLFSGAHAAAQRAQANAITTGVPAANQTLSQIDSALAANQITPAQAKQLYSQLQTQFHSLMTQGTSYTHGDALWTCDIALQLVIAARNADLNAGVLTGGGAGPWIQTATPTASTASSSGAAVGSGTTSANPSAAVSSSPSTTPDYTPLIGIGAALAAALILIL